MTGKERLAKLADLLHKIPPYRFDLEVWISRPQACNTVACAVGHAVLSGEFRDEGLDRIDGTPSFNGFTSWGAVMEFFEIDSSVAYKLFSPNGYPAGTDTMPGEVAQAIRNYLADVKA